MIGLAIEVAVAALAAVYMAARTHVMRNPPRSYEGRHR